MCGRYTHLFTWEELHRLCTLTAPPITLPRSYNVAPTQSAPVVRLIEGGGRGAGLFRWGLVPFWAEDPKIGSALINARAETVADKPAFRAAFKARRCLVPVSGFYEWKKMGAHKQPYYIRAAADEPLLLAGLWESWRPRPAEDAAHAAPLETYTIITTTPNELLATLHDRMPVIIAPEDQARWLEGTHYDAQSLLKPSPAELLMCHPVSTRVNSPRNNEAACIEPV